MTFKNITPAILTALSVPFFMVACSSSPNSTLATNSGTTTDGTTTLGSTTTGSTTTGSTTSGNLFDTTTSSDAAPSSTTTTTTTPDASESACLSGLFGSSVDASTNGASQLQCLSNSAYANGFGTSSLYNATTGTFNGLNECIQIVSQIAPQSGATQDQINLAFSVAAAAEVRCIRQILNAQMSYPLSSGLIGGMSQNDALLYQMIASFLGTQQSQ